MGPLHRSELRGLSAWGSNINLLRVLAVHKLIQFLTGVTLSIHNRQVVFAPLDLCTPALLSGTQRVEPKDIRVNVANVAFASLFSVQASTESGLLAGVKWSKSSRSSALSHIADEATVTTIRGKIASFGHSAS